MALLTREELQKLIDVNEGPCVSLYIPTERAGRATRQNPIRFKNAMYAARNALQGRGMRKREADQFLAPARQLLEDADFWQQQADGLAAFVARHLFASYRLPLHVEEFSAVGEHFHIKPLLPFFSRDGRFYVLALSQNAVRVLEGTHWSVRHLDVRGMPGDLAEALRFDVRERHLQFHTGTGAGRGGGTRAAIFHGQGVPKDDEQDRIREYLRQIDAALHRVLKGQRAPLVLAGAEGILPIYRRVNTYPHLVDDAVKGNPDQLNEQQLHDQAWPLVEPVFLEGQRRAAEMVEGALGTERASADLEQVVQAAHLGRVEALFVPLARHRWGSYDDASGQVLVHDEGQPGDEDLLDQAAAQVMVHDGAVYAVEPQEMPDDADEVAALFRY
jgi:hypothetical protein